MLEDNWHPPSPIVIAFICEEVGCDSVFCLRLPPSSVEKAIIDSPG